MRRINEETMAQIRDDADVEITEMETMNQTNLNQVTDMKRRSEADLSST